MADILCPICKRPNDSDAERCWFCQAVLPKEENPQENEESDWLSDLRGDSTMSGDEISDQSEMQNDQESENPEEIPDWLVKIRLREQEEKSALDNEKQEIHYITPTGMQCL